MKTWNEIVSENKYIKFGRQMNEDGVIVVDFDIINNKNEIAHSGYVEKMKDGKWKAFLNSMKETSIAQSKEKAVEQLIKTALKWKSRSI
jgi:hypothetical protein